MITKWTREAFEGIKERFASGGKAHRVEQNAEVRTLQAESGEQLVERGFIARTIDR